MKCKDIPDFAPFYLLRGNIFRDINSTIVLNNYLKALELNENEWRTYHLLTEYFNQQSLYDKAIFYAEKGSKKFLDNFVSQFDYAKTLLYNSDFKACLAILDKINILPNEGARDGHDIYWLANMITALDKIKNKRYKDAIQSIEKAELWPENLGAGKPYDVDNRLESYMKAICFKKMGDKLNEEKFYQEIIKFMLNYPEYWNSNCFINSLALKKTGREREGRAFIDLWVKKFPDNVIAQWSAARYDIDKQKAEALLKKKELINRKDFWLPYNGDLYFKFILELEKLNGN